LIYEPRGGLHLAKARQSLAKGHAMLTIEMPDEAGRTAYLAAFHAAQALIFERTGRTPKTHRGVRTQFGALARAESNIDIVLRQFLTDGYDLKTVADYEIGPEAVVSIVDAQAAIDTSGRFVEYITALLAAS
jgi:uncharacterized protein (UPF0332 family)